MPKVNPEHEKARRKQILEAALACFMESGFHETTVDDVAAGAELSKGAIYTISLFIRVKGVRRFACSG